MRFYDPNPVKEMNYVRSWNPPMEDGAGIGNLNDTFSGLGVNDSSSKDSIFQVMKAVEDAEHTIKKQVEENNELRTELLRRTRELEKYKSDATALKSSSGVMRDENMSGPYNAHLSTSPLGSEAEKLRWMDNGSSSVSQGSSAIQNGLLKSENTSLQANAGTRHYLETIRLNETSKVVPSVPVSVGNAGFSQLSSPSSRSVSPSRNRKEGEYDSRLNIGSHGLMQISEINSSSSLWKQDLVLKVREHEEEIVQLRRHLAEYSMKEAQIRNEKYVLEKRIAHMRMAFDQQQQDLVDAASKALSYRQDIIEENIRLTYALQAAQQERSTFISALMPLLTEYGLQPPVPDAPSIVSNLKALFKHLQEKLIITEDKLKESQYQLAPWHAEISNNSTFTPQSPSHSFGAALTTSNKPGLEIVAQPSYSYPQLPVSSPSNAQSRADWDTLGQQSYPMGSIGVSTKNLDNENMGRSSPIVSRNSMVDVPARVAVTQSDSHVVRFSEETKSQNPLFKDLVRGNDMDDSEAVEVAQGREASAHWSSTTGSSPYMASRDDPNSSYPYLPPVPEEPSSSFSEAAEDDPLPAIEGLQIAGDAFPGRELQASGYSINGTTSCNFEWVRYLEDGSVNYIDGAKQPKYLVTADDVDSYLAIEVQPLDNRKRKGELVKVFANEQRKIACDPEMQVQLESALSLGHASFEVSLSAGVLNIWEHAILAIKRDGYSIKCNGTRGVVVMEKFSPTTVIAIPYGHATEFHIHGASGAEHVLKTGDNSSLRDTVVLTMRLFIMRAVEKRKGRKKVLFFK